MSADTGTGRGSVGARTVGLVQQTLVAIRGALSRADGRLAFAGTGVGYLLVYAYGLGHLGLGPWGFDLSIVADPLARTFEPVGPFQWEPIGLLVLGPFELLIAPLNVLLGSALAILVGLNLAVSLVAWRGPSACRLGPGMGAAAGVPALLSGVVCCGPVILLVVGIQASAGLIAAFQWFLPVSVLALVGTLLWVGRRVESA
jgi:hypothetical protein